MKRRRDRFGLEPRYRRAFLRTDLGVVIEDTERDRIMAQNHLVEDGAVGGVDIDDVLLGERAQERHALVFAHGLQDRADMAGASRPGGGAPGDLALPFGLE